MPKCTFCGNELTKGTGKRFVHTSGKIDFFCSSKCEKNMLELKRKPLNVRWTQEYRREHKKGINIEAKAESGVEQKAQPKSSGGKK